MKQKILYATAGAIPEESNGEPVVILLNGIWFLNESNEQKFLHSVTKQGLHPHKLCICLHFNYEGVGAVLRMPKSDKVPSKA